MTLPPTVWDGVLRRLDGALPRYALEAWVRPLVPKDSGAALRLSCPSLFHKQRVSERYLDAIARCAAEEAGRPVRVELLVDASARPPAGRPRITGGTPVRPEARPPAPPEHTAPGSSRTAAAARPGDERSRPEQYGFDSFVVGPCNALAREASYALAHDRQIGLSPLFLSGPTGLGKTHLARAVAREAVRRRRTRVIYTSAEGFTNEFVNSLRSKQTASFKRRFREECDLLVLEDVHFLRGKRSTQLELFHTVHHLLEAGARVVLTADRLPREIPELDARLASTLARGLVAELDPPDSRVRRQILRARAAACGVRLPAACLNRLVAAVRGSVRDLESALTQVVATATLLGRPIDLELTEAALRKVLPGPHAAGRPEPEAVIETVAIFFGTSAAKLASRSRSREVMVPRQIAMYLCRRYTDASLSRIARAFARSHPSVSNAIGKVERAILVRPKLRYQLEAAAAHLESALGSPAPPQ